MGAGRPRCALRIRLEELYVAYPSKVARELVYAEAILKYCQQNVDVTLKEFDKEQARLRNHIRVLQHKIKNGNGVGP